MSNHPRAPTGRVLATISHKHQPSRADAGAQQGEAHSNLVEVTPRARVRCGIKAIGFTGLHQDQGCGPRTPARHQGPTVRLTCHLFKAKHIHGPPSYRSLRLQTRCRGIDTILKLPEESVYSEFARRVVPSAEIPEDPQDLLKQWINQLAQVFHDNFVKAAREQDITQLTAVFQLFPLIRKSDMGLDLYSKYVCDMIATQSRKVMTSTTSKSPGFFAQALLHLFKIVSTIINEHSKIIAKYYGKQHMVHIMAKVQREADMQAGLVLDSFFESRNFKEILQDIRAFKENVSPEEEGLTSNAPSMSEVSGIISQL